MGYPKARFLFLIILMIFLVLAGWHAGLLTMYTTEQKLTLFLLVIAIYFWTISRMPFAASSLLVVGLIIIFDLVDRPEEAFTGFLTTALYFILVLSLISKALVAAGADRVFVTILLKLSRGGIRTILFGLPLLIALMPIFLPSAVARFRILEPIIEQLNATFTLEQDSMFRKYSMYVIGMMNQNSTMIVFTGGGFPVLAAQLLKDFGGVQISWIGWFILIAPPLWLSMFLVSFGVFKYFQRTTEEVIVEAPQQLDEDTQLPKRFWWIVLPFGLMILSWVVLDQETVPLIIAPIILAAYYALPINNLVTDSLVRSYDWENFLLLGASFSLGYVIEETGTALILAGQMLELLPDGIGDFGNILFVAIFIFILRFLFVVPSTSMIVIFPIIMSYAEILGLSVITLAFLVIMIIGGVTIMPIHSPTTFLAFQKGAFSKKEQYAIGGYSSFIISTIAIIWALFIW
ncbi:SLC13 family permease [Planomicrobium sp. Y74]|uniref:SLC13 family permease n=1 Tax=Planomicrobium sp. Y74 TaxID=2478977 RepID=UPI00256FAEC5|nr:SLC13 family permease [Planomicrobium sp. Y74]